jgi:hypothetical protein
MLRQPFITDLVDDPIFGVGAPPNPDTWVFHYTGLESALAMGKSKTLRFSPMSAMNDPREFRPAGPVTLAIGSSQSETQIEAALQRLKERRLSIRAGSFTLDAAEGKPSSWDRAEGRGYARPTMWTHYGNRHRGVCLVINRDKLQQALTTKFGSDTFSASVTYSHGLDPEDWSRYLESAEVADFGVEQAVERYLTRYRRQVLFEKNSDWKPEREWRVCIDHQSAKSIVDVELTSGVVEGIVLGLDFPLKDLAKIEIVADALGVGDRVVSAYLQQMNLIDIQSVEQARLTLQDVAPSGRSFGSSVRRQIARISRTLTGLIAPGSVRFRSHRRRKKYRDHPFHGHVW